MKKSLCFLAAVIFLMSFGFSRAEAKGRYGQWELAPGAAYGFGFNDFDRLENNHSYALWLSYWLNDTSTLDINFSYLQSRYKVDIYEEGEPASKEHPDWNMFWGTLGVRYQPQWDSFLDFGFGAGLGYEGWATKGKEINNRDGGSIIYYLLADAEYPIKPWFSIGAYVQPLYLPLATHIEKSVTIDTAGDSHFEYNSLGNGLIVNAGIWFAFRIY